jgi:hypothetical protein
MRCLDHPSALPSIEFGYALYDEKMRVTGAGSLCLILLAGFAAATLTSCSSIHLNPSQPTSVVTWPQPAPITNPAPLTSEQLNATAKMPGTFVYSPAAGTVLPAGTKTLTTTFTPTDTAHYTTATASVTITVNAAPGRPAPVNPSHLAVADEDNNRVLIYDTPFSDGESASVVLGQLDFTHHLANQGGAAAANTFSHGLGGQSVCGGWQLPRAPIPASIHHQYER